MNKVVKAVLITTIFGIATKAIAFLIKIYISRIIGAESLGYYQIALSGFMLFYAIVTSGLPIVISRYISKDNKYTQGAMGSGLFIGTTLAIVCMTLCYCCTGILNKIWADGKIVNVLYFLLPALLFTAIYLPFRGSFWGKKQFFELGFIELIEQIIKLACLILFFNLFNNIAGEVNVAICFSIACLFSTIIAIIMYIKKNKTPKFSLALIKPIVKQTIPIATVRVGTSVVSLFISVAFPLVLAKTGLQTNQAVAIFGVITGMVLPLITIPGTIIGSIAMSILPEIAGGDYTKQKSQINQAINYSSLLSIVLVPIFFFLGEEIGIIVFKSTMAGIILKYASFVMIPLGLSQITTSILNSLGKEKQSLLYSAIGSIFLICSALFFPKYIGEYSLIVGFGIMSVTTLILNLISIKKYLNTIIIKYFIKLVLILLPCSLICKWTSQILFYFNLSNLFVVAICCLLFAICCAVMFTSFKIVNILNFIPTKFKSKLQNRV